MGQEQGVVCDVKHPLRQPEKIAPGLARREGLEQQLLDRVAVGGRGVYLRPHGRQVHSSGRVGGGDKSFENHAKQSTAGQRVR